VCALTCFTCTARCVNARAKAHTRATPHTRTHKHTYTHACTCALKACFARMQARVHKHTEAHTQAHTHTHTCTQNQKTHASFACATYLICVFCTAGKRLNPRTRMLLNLDSSSQPLLYLSLHRHASN